MLKICVFTGTRAEYGLLRPLLFKLKEDKEIDLTIVVSGGHLSEKYGYTYKEILKDENPKNLLAQKLSANYGMTKQEALEMLDTEFDYPDDKDIKYIIFKELVKDKFNRHISFMLWSYRSGNMVIHPKPLIFSYYDLINFIK